MFTVYKYEVSCFKTILAIPEGAEIVSVKCIGDKFYFWAGVDTSKPKEERVFEVFGTGQLIPQDLDYNFIGTGFMSTGLVFHLLEQIG